MGKNIFQPKILLLIVLLFSIPVFVGAQWLDSYRLNKNTKVAIPAHSNCKVAENTGSVNDYFVPTKTATEWTSFINNKPSDVVFQSCTKTGGVGGIDGIYTAAQYYKKSNCGHTPPCFLEIPIGSSEVVSQSSTGGICGLSRL